MSQDEETIFTLYLLLYIQAETLLSAAIQWGNLQVWHSILLPDTFYHEDHPGELLKNPVEYGQLCFIQYTYT